MSQPECVVVRPAHAQASKQGNQMFTGISATTAGASGLCFHLVTVPAGGRARAHLHEAHESAIYVLSGRGATWYGPRLEHRAVTEQGDFLYIPAGLPHLPVNLSDTEPLIGLIARTDPEEQESVVLLPELDGLPHLG